MIRFNEQTRRGRSHSIRARLPYLLYTIKHAVKIVLENVIFLCNRNYILRTLNYIQKMLQLNILLFGEEISSKVKSPLCIKIIQRIHSTILFCAKETKSTHQLITLTAIHNSFTKLLKGFYYRVHREKFCINR